MTQHVNDDILAACADLADRCGASGFEIGYVHDDVPVEEAGWYAFVTFRGARISADDHRSPTAAALALAERLLSGAMCRCRRPVTLSDQRDGCRWRLIGARWEPGCDVAPVHVEGARGDYTAMQRAMAQPMNRADRRKLKKGGR
jgi:hypothetical protein